MESLLLKNITIDDSWNDFLSTKTTTSILSRIEKDIYKKNIEVTPTKNKVLRFLNISLNDVKIIILGQDPYPQKGVATGRAFEVGVLKSWNDTFKNISLKNIVRSIYYAYTAEYKKYSSIKEEIDNSFDIMPPNKLFSSWENQGVLLLNTSFTCELGKSNSHAKIWEPFTAELLKYISEKNKKIIWFLWGNNAINITKNIKIENKLVSMHPMMCYSKKGRENDFLFGEINHFKETKNIINWTGV
ncbi:MAG: uracil-DNA glycosylase [Bacteroidetes bacterium]|nr:MAG: uracil-DNA glycosylase [Bacteroidota bacterium]